MNINPKVQEILMKLDVSFKQMEAILAGLTPRNSIETDSLSLLKNQIRTIKAGVKTIIAAHSGNEDPNIANAGNIEEMTAMAGSSAMGIAGKKPGYKAKKSLKTENKSVDPEQMLRESIRAELYKLYKIHGDLLFEEAMAPWTNPEDSQDNMADMPPQSEETKNSTGINVLIPIWKQLRPKIEESYIKLTTDPEQRQNYQNHLLELVNNAFSLIDNGQDSVDSDSLLTTNNLSQKGIGYTSANSSFNSIKNQLIGDDKNIGYKSLDNQEDKQSFKEKLMEQLGLLFKTMENQFDSSQSTQTPNNSDISKNNTPDNMNMNNPLSDKQPLSDNEDPLQALKQGR